MHEMGVCDGILKAAIEAATDQGAVKINSIDITVGELMQVVEESLQFAFEVLREDSMAAQAVLNVTFLPAEAHCLDCGTVFNRDLYDVKCPNCGSYLGELIQGRELRIDSIDID